MSRPDGALLVLGIGNVLLRDEGVGVRVVDEIGRLADRGDIALPPGAELLDGGTRGLALLPAVADARAVLVIDAARLGREPGSVSIVRGDALRAAPDGDATARPCGLAWLLELARAAGDLPAAVSLVGIEPARIDVGLEMSDAVRTAVPAAVSAALDEMQRLHEDAAAVALTEIDRLRETPGAAGRGRAAALVVPTQPNAQVTA